MDAIAPARHLQKSSQYVRACVEGDGAICSKNRKIVPYHGANPNTRNGARLRSPSPIMAPVLGKMFVTPKILAVDKTHLLNGPVSQRLRTTEFTNWIGRNRY